MSEWQRRYWKGRFVCHYSPCLMRPLATWLTICHFSHLVWCHPLVLSFPYRCSLCIFAMSDERRGPKTASFFVSGCLRGLWQFFLSLSQECLSLFQVNPGLVWLHFGLLSGHSTSYPALSGLSVAEIWPHSVTLNPALQTNAVAHSHEEATAKPIHAT